MLVMYYLLMVPYIGVSVHLQGNYALRTHSLERSPVTLSCNQASHFLKQIVS